MHNNPGQNEVECCGEEERADCEADNVSALASVTFPPNSHISSYVEKMLALTTYQKLK